MAETEFHISRHPPRSAGAIPRTSVWSALFGIARLCAVAVLATGCAGAPGAGAREAQARIARGELISYRRLTREDFRAASRPTGQTAHDPRFGALTCMKVWSGPDTRVEITETLAPGGGSEFTAAIRELEFVVLFDRDCSWFDPSITDKDAAYVLQHEQIHFALEELSVRRLNAGVASLIGVPFADTTADEAQQRARNQVDEMFRDARRRAEAQTQQLDRETSYGFHPERQKKWFERVTRALGQ